MIKDIFSKEKDGIYRNGKIYIEKKIVKLENVY